MARVISALLHYVHSLHPTPPLYRPHCRNLTDTSYPSVTHQRLINYRYTDHHTDHYMLWFTPDLQRILVSRFGERNRFLRFFKKLLKNSKKQR